MRPSSIRALCAALATALCLPHAAQAEDIDLFTTPAGGGVAPNILIVLDNSANWNANNQAWPTGKQGEGELRALWNLMGDSAVNTSVNIGLMMMQSTNQPEDSAYIRFAVRNMTPANKAALQEMIGTSTCAAGNNSLTGKKNCILKDFSSNTGLTGSASDASGEMTSSASTRYEGAMFETFKYFGGYTDPAHAITGPGGAPVNSTHFGPAVFAQKSVKADPAAYSGANYVSPIGVDNACAKNFVIFIGNGYPSQSSSTSYLTGINGNVTVPPPVGNKANFTANWSKYLFTTDVSAQGGRQNVVTYAIDVFNAQQDANQTALMKAMAKYGGGRYFEARNDQAIINALKEIIIEIQAVNSVFASASLPINATNRSQNENQVFIGMFRPDGDAKPKWFGNLKQYQVQLFSGDAKLADANGIEAIAATTGFLQACANSFWTTDSGNYWDWSANSLGSCANQNPYSDSPDGGIVEKGGAAEVVRKGNTPPAGVGPYVVTRNMYTMGSSFGSITPFNTAAVTQARTGAATAAENTSLVDFIKGLDVLDENGNANFTEPRPTIHGDIAHSRPLPVNYGSPRGVVVYYGANDGTFKAVQGSDGKELWSFVAPEHHSKLLRLYKNDPPISYPNIVSATATRKDYFFDGSAGLYQNADNSKVWIFPTMRRGGRMVYAFDVTTPTIPVLKWSFGCPNMANDTGCSAGGDKIGQTWSGPNVAFVKGFNAGADPLVVMGGGYDNCEDSDASVTTCTSSNKGNRVYVLRADTGAILQVLNTDRAVAADVTLLDRNFDGLVDYAYVADTGGSLYRINFVDPATNASIAPGAWTITKIASTAGSGRKFLNAPSALVLGDVVYLALGSGDRERPLITNYPYVSSVLNRFYAYIDNFQDTNVNLDGASMANFTSDTDCNTVLGSGMRGWFMDLNAGRGEQTVTSSVIFGGTVFFSTNRPVPNVPGTCGNNLGEARGYAVNVLNASGVIGTGSLCGGQRSGSFTGGGLPPSPVVGTVPVNTPGGPKPISVLIGGIDVDTGSGSPIGAQQPPVPIRQIRSRLYWYPMGER